MWRLVDIVQRANPERNILDILRQFLHVCPEGMITPDVVRYLKAEVVCETYKSPPVEGGTDNWPAKTLDAFEVIRRTQQQIVLEKQRELRAQTGK